MQSLLRMTTLFMAVPAFTFWVASAFPIKGSLVVTFTAIAGIVTLIKAFLWANGRDQILEELMAREPRYLRTWIMALLLTPVVWSVLMLASVVGVLPFGATYVVIGIGVVVGAHRLYMGRPGIGRTRFRSRSRSQPKFRHGISG